MQKVFSEKTRFCVAICCLYLSSAEKNPLQHSVL